MLEEKQGLVFGEEYDTNGEFALIDEGEYEVAIDKIEKRTSKAGNQCLSFSFVIRKDVDQKFQGRKLFYTVTKKADDNTGVYDYNRINKLILTQKNKKTFKKQFNDADEVLLYLNGIHLTVNVKVEFDDYTGKDRNVIEDFSFAPSKWDEQEHDTGYANGPAEELAKGIDDPTFPF